MTEKITKTNLEITTISGIDRVYQHISGFLQTAQGKILQTINTEMVKVYWKIGREIVEQEQHGKERADYGKKLISILSQKLIKEFGKGYSISNLGNMRQFYLSYQEQIHQTESGEFTYLDAFSDAAE